MMSAPSSSARVGVDHQDEVVAALVAEERSLGADHPDRRLQGLGGEEQQVVPVRESVVVVEGLEVVEVGVDDRHVFARIDRLLDGAGDGVVTGQMGERIGVDGQFLQARDFLQQLGHADLRADAREEFAEVAGLGDVVDAARLVAAVDLVGRGLGHHEDHGDVDEARDVLQAFAQREAVHLTHVGRDEEEVGHQGLDDREGAGAAGGGDHLVALRTQRGGVDAQIQIGVVDDDDPGGLATPRGHGSRTRVQWAAASDGAGGSLHGIGGSRPRLRTISVARGGP